MPKENEYAAKMERLAELGDSYTAHFGGERLAGRIDKFLSKYRKSESPDHSEEAFEHWKKLARSAIKRAERKDTHVCSNGRKMIREAQSIIGDPITYDAISISLNLANIKTEGEMLSRETLRVTLTNEKGDVVYAKDIKPSYLSGV